MNEATGILLDAVARGDPWVGVLLGSSMLLVCWTITRIYN